MKNVHILWLLAAPTIRSAFVGEKRTVSRNTFSTTEWGTSSTITEPTVIATSPSFSNTTTTVGSSSTGTGVATGTSSTAVPYKLQVPPLDTPWTDKVGLHPWPEHPRPQLQRADWKTLNGLWTWQSAGNATEFTEIPQGPLQYETLVPSCIESAISGLQILDVSSMWYETTFQVPSGWKGQSVLLHFEAVDYESTVFVNGQQVGSFTGGYFRNTIDVTQFLKSGGTNEL